MRITCLLMGLVVPCWLVLDGSLIPSSSLPCGWESVAVQSASKVWGAHGLCQHCPEDPANPGEPLLNAVCPGLADGNAPCTQKYSPSPMGGFMTNGCWEPPTNGCTGNGKWNQCAWIGWACWQNKAGRCGNPHVCVCEVASGGVCTGLRNCGTGSGPCRRDCM